MEHLVLLAYRSVVYHTLLVFGVFPSYGEGGKPTLWQRGTRWFSTLAMLHATCVDIYTVSSVRSSQPRVEAISHHRTPHSEQLRQVPPVSPPAANGADLGNFRLFHLRQFLPPTFLESVRRYGPGPW